MAGDDNNDRTRTNALDRRIGQRIRAQRLSLGVSQEKLADALGVTFQQVQAFEKGLERVSASLLIGIAHTLGVSVGSLMPVARSPRNVAAVEEPELAELAVTFSQLNAAGRKLLLRAAALLASEPSLLLQRPVG